ncbi:alpha/beta fold hydrolase [Streptomonospora nanhaiensis]|uniref:Pimeloyl-ACP methyl ester carboxylesterase n=1 Tax=Streptomonospora nanhaiensis TaxID=1323731 RepID=A0A853BQ91_9ACTN|nr:alpha/beta hydrolase [Streptomonospora nanhaiensis]MBV2366797.1 alpha/beta hydrolase [Streptomonospora nanhaiensis]MBX9387699.1 alpha/beta hydrolase [Streptomonospora nanhaiensis]NYI96875.1 pimeloyl-ACP methyl ester carboxylesterase [Streptomonospora nanhaiensis]
MTEESAVLIDGPWTHRTVSAAGTRFHIAECGEGPLVLLLHGFPQFWWAWHEQMTALAGAGYRVVALDQRGYGASDKPPRGYDLITLASDAAGLIRALGEADAAVVGHAGGGLLAWTMAVYFPQTVRRLAVLSMPHPRRLREAVLTGGQGWAGRHVAGFQVPVVPERRLVADDARHVADMLRAWSRPGWPDPQTERHLRDAMRIPGVAHCSLEFHRWLVRSQFRPDGHRYMRRMRRPITVPTLHLHGALDPVLLPATARGSGRYVDAPYRWRLIEGAGHFPHQERPRRVNDVLTGWLADTEPDD